MGEKISVAEYLRMPETTRPMELVYGAVREPPAPRYGHQSVVTTIAALLREHVRERGLGVVCVSPLDVVLDAARGLVVQPDVVFIAAARTGIIRDQVWGAPDLVAEVLSPRTMQRDRTTKLRWYRRAGVGEAWLVDPAHRRVTVVALNPPGRRRAFAGATRIVSGVLPEFDRPATEMFLG